MLTLPSMLQRTARMYGTNPAIRDPAGDLDWRAWTGRIARAGGMLRHTLGIAPGQRVGILARNCVRQAELVYAGY
jgi:acyl-CoA synthetase (AMP-forming)/AMP-acid ligase II